MAVRPSIAWLLCGLATCVAAEHVTRGKAAACSPPTPHVSIPDVPANGAVVVTVYCGGFECLLAGELEELTVLDTTTGLPVPGAMVARQSLGDGGIDLRWKPEEPLAEGRAYEIDWRPSQPGFLDDADAYELVALPAATWTLDALWIDAMLLRDSAAEELAVCEIVPPPFTGGECTRGPNQRGIATRVRSFVRLLAGVAPGDVELDRQYEVSAVMFAQGDTPPPLGEKSWPEGMFERRFDDVEQSYCYQIELRSFIDDSTSLREDCIEHGAIGDLGVTDVPLTTIESALLDCIEPPEGLLTEYCRAHRASCEERAPTCDEVEAQCPDSPREDGGREVGDAGAQDATDESAGADVDASLSDRRAMSGSSGGDCATVGPHPADGSLGALLALCVLARARRRWVGPRRGGYTPRTRR